MDNKKSSENKSTQGNCEYDNDPVFRQGIAIVSKNKKYGAIMVGGKEIVPPIYDALSDFVDGFATAKYRNEERTINLSGQIQVKKGEEYVFLPQEYDWGNDFVDNICIVEKIYRQINWQTVGQFGIISVKNNPNSTEISFEVLLSCEYSSIRPLKDGFFLIVKDSRCGLINSDGEIVAETKYCQITNVAEKYFQLDTIADYYPKYNHVYCIIDEKGDPMTPNDCSEIKHISINKSDYWIVTKDKSKGVYCCNSEIVPVVYKEIKPSSVSFECTRYDDSIVRYNLNGQVVVNYSGSQIVFPSDCSVVLDSPIGLFRAMKDKKWGIINQKKEWVVPNKYVFIDSFQNGFAIILEKEPEDSLFPRYGLIDTIGNVVLPTEYNELSFRDGYWIVCKDHKYGLLSSSLSEIVPPTYSKMEHLKNGLFIVTQDGDKLLIDNTGKEILAPASFDEIELFGDTFFKLIKYCGYGHSDNDKNISIINQNGETIVDYGAYQGATYLNDGLIKLYGMGGGQALVNFQGERIYEWSYDEIKKRDNGLFSLRSEKRWGVGDVSGNIIIDIEYLDEIVFDNDAATIRVDETIRPDGSSYSCEQKVNREGTIIVHDGEKEIELPKCVYWGTNFTNGISIVRRKKDSYDERNIIGVADVHKNIIIPTIYEEIRLLSNNTILVKANDCCGMLDLNRHGLSVSEGRFVFPPIFSLVNYSARERIFDINCYGIYDLKGNVIFPPIFSLINYIAEDRIRVCWNVNIAKEWNNTGYTPGLCEEKKTLIKFLEGYRATLCNSKGEIVCDKDYLYVGNFINQYAPAYKEIYVENGRIRYRMGGVIDVTGKTVIEPKNDGITLYKDSQYIKVREGDKFGLIDYANNTILKPIYDDIGLYNNSQYARTLKDGKVGITDLQSKKERIFEDINIQRQGGVDTHKGYADINDTEDGIIDGIVVVSSRQYEGFKLLDNGLIKVSKRSEECPFKLFGLLNDHGEEILPLKYTVITSFDNNRAKICVGGKYDENGGIKNGKWGVIDDAGRIVVDCKYDSITLYENGVIKVLNNSGEIPELGLLNECGDEILPINDDIDDVWMLSNGLMKVRVWSYYGLLDRTGNEILPTIYSYISDFRDGLATICAGEEMDWDEEVATKKRWGIIDSTGKFIKECKYTWEEVYGETDENNVKEFRAPFVIMTDKVKCDEPLYADCYEDYSYDDDYSGYSKYGGYNGYDDNTIDEAFEGDPSLTWNID